MSWILPGKGLIASLKGASRGKGVGSITGGERRMAALTKDERRALGAKGSMGYLGAASTEERKRVSSLGGIASARISSMARTLRASKAGKQRNGHLTPERIRQIAVNAGRASAKARRRRKLEKR